MMLKLGQRCRVRYVKFETIKKGTVGPRLPKSLRLSETWSQPNLNCNGQKLSWRVCVLWIYLFDLFLKCFPTYKRTWKPLKNEKFMPSAPACLLLLPLRTQEPDREVWQLTPAAKQLGNGKLGKMKLKAQLCRC